MSKNSFYWVILFCFFSIANVDGQIKSDLKNIFETSKDYFGYPAHLSSEDYQKLGLIFLSTSSSSLIDKELKNFSQAESKTTNPLLSNFDSYYHIEFMSASILGLYFYGNLADNDESKKLAVNLLSSSLLTGISTLGLKILFGRSRPYESASQYEFNWFEFEDRYLSFPSGHTSLAFSFSTIMAEQNKTFLWKSFWFSAAALVGVSRIYNNQHWFSDVLFGAVIGYLTAKFVLSHNKKDSPSNPMDLNKELNSPTNNIVFTIRF